ncbi:hypothetical protein BDW22DRAFT_342948 [Trametopsis cervina]|nr:hypothetical protein BDW22DRAFT_342948 [Trametopsis cervina]
MPRAKAPEPALSQHSDGSEDSGLMAAVAKQVQSTLEKKKRDNETRFLAGAKAELLKSASAEVSDFEDAINEMKAHFDTFIMQYAAAEDNIRSLWEELLVAHQEYVAGIEQQHAVVVESEVAREKGQVKGMAVSKKAVEDFETLISSLTSDS